MIPKHTHDHNLAKYCRMDLCKCLEWYPQFKRTRCFEFYCIEQSKTADLANHFVFGKTLDERATKVLAGYCRALSKPFVLEDIEGRSEEHTSELQSLRHL